MSKTPRTLDLRDRDRVKITEETGHTTEYVGTKSFARVFLPEEETPPAEEPIERVSLAQATSRPEPPTKKSRPYNRKIKKNTSEYGTYTTRRPLSEEAIRNMTTMRTPDGKTRQQIHSDTLCPGLKMRVGNSFTWNVRYQPPGQNATTLLFAVHPRTPLSERKNRSTPQEQIMTYDLAAAFTRRFLELAKTYDPKPDFLAGRLVLTEEDEEPLRRRSREERAQERMLPPNTPTH